MARAGYIAPHKSTTSRRSARVQKAAILQDDIHGMSLQVLDKVTDLEYAKVVMKTKKTSAGHYRRDG